LPGAPDYGPEHMSEEQAAERQFKRSLSTQPNHLGFIKPSNYLLL